MYGVAVADLGLSPSEVRGMTPHEIMAVVSAKTRNQTPQAMDEADKQDLYNTLQDARA